MTDLESEIRQLKKSVAHLRFLLVAMCCTLVGCVAVSRRPVMVHAEPAPAAVPDVVTAKQFVVVDDAGNQSVVIGPVPGQTDQHSTNTGPVDYRGLAVFASDHTLVASLGLATPKPPAVAFLATHYTELFLQSDDTKSSQAYLRSFNGAPAPNDFGQTVLHLSNLSQDLKSSAAIDELAKGANGVLGIQAHGTVGGGQGAATQSTLRTGIGGPTGLQNCPTYTNPPNCDTWH